VSIRKAADSRPSRGPGSIVVMIPEGKLRTKSRNDCYFLTVLALEAVRNPRAIRGSHRHAANAREHVAGCHNQGSEYGNRRPDPAVAENRS